MSEKRENIKMLLELNGGSTSYRDSVLSVIYSIKHLIPNFDIENFDINELDFIFSDIENNIISIYDKYFTEDEVLEIIEFYKSSIGKVYLAKMNKVTLECLLFGNKQGEFIYNKLIEFYSKKEI